jgi:hypothetical protein
MLNQVLLMLKKESLKMKFTAWHLWFPKWMLNKLMCKKGMERLIIELIASLKHMITELSRHLYMLQ